MGQYDSWDYLTNFIKKNLNCLEEELAKPPYAVKVKKHPKRPNLVMFKYSQFESDFTNPIVRCCRGSVYDIREDKTVTPYLLPFFKFNNYGEVSADPINWNGTLFIHDKLDGSLIKLLKEPDGNDLWTTNGSFDIDVEIPEIIPASNDEDLPPPYTFASLRNFALRGREDEIKNLPALWTFMFELTSPYNRIIVPYKETKLTLLGCRDPDKNEHTPEWAVKEFNLTFETPKLYKFNSIDEIIAWSSEIQSADVEGLVIQDEYFNRIKIKTEHYRSLFYLKGDDHFSDSRIFDSIRQGSIDDAIAAWPEIIPKTDQIKNEWISFRNGVFDLCGKASQYYNECVNDCNDAKEAKKRYAQFVMDKHQKFSSFLFEAVKENADLERLFNKIDYKELRSYWLPALED